jgi:hypothetical protein
MGTSLGDDIRDRASAVAEVCGGVSGWLSDTSALLSALQDAVEQMVPRESAGNEARQLMAQLPILLRQCRSQVPTPDMVRTWVRVLTEPKNVPYHGAAVDCVDPLGAESGR